MITYIPSKEDQLQVPETLNVAVYTLIAALRRGGAPEAELQHLERLCRDHLNPLAEQEKQVISQVLLKKLLAEKPESTKNPLEDSAEIKDKDFL